MSLYRPRQVRCQCHWVAPLGWLPVGYTTSRAEKVIPVQMSEAVMAT